MVAAVRENREMSGNFKVGQGKKVNERVIKKKIFRRNYFLLKKYLMVSWQLLDFLTKLNLRG